MKKAIIEREFPYIMTTKTPYSYDEQDSTYTNK